MKIQVLESHTCMYACTYVGVLGIKVKIMLPHDPTGKTGPKKPLPDNVQVVEPKAEGTLETPYSEQKLGKPAFEQPPAQPVQQQPI